MFNPLKIPIERIDENKGTVQFTLSASNIFDKAIPRLKILEVYKNQTVFVLERDAEFDLKFIQSHPNYSTKVAKVDIRDYEGSPKLFISFTWSDKGNNAIYVGNYKEKELRSSTSYESSNLNFRVGKDGSIYQIGDEGVKVGSYRVVMGQETVLEPTAIELFKFQIEKVNVLIENCRKGDFLFETTISQLVIVALVTAFESYTRTRFTELEKEGKELNIEELYKCFVPNTYRQSFIEDTKESATKNGVTELEVLISTRRINFQDWESFKDAYNKGYGLRIGDIGVSNDILIDLQQSFKWRHKIIHSKDDQTIINMEELPSKKPLFTNKDLAEKCLDTFQQFITALHKASVNL